MAEQLQVLQAGASAQGQIGEGQHMVGLVVGQVQLKQVEASVDGLGESEARGEGVDGSDAPDGESTRALGNFIVNVAGGHDGFGAAAEVGFIEASLDASLAVGQHLSYALSHLKPLVAWSGGERLILHETPETPRDFEFFHKSLLPKAGDFALLRPRRWLTARRE